MALLLEGTAMKLYYLNFNVHFTEKYIVGYMLAHFQTNKT